MKHINKLIIAGVITASVLSCSEPEIPAANVTTSAAAFSANFLFVNATPDAPSLSFFVNNAKIGTDAGSDANYAQPSYTPVALTSPGLAGSVTNNTNIKARAASGTIGGLLGTNDLLLRATNTGFGNLVAINGNSYTVFTIDSLTRPAPLRTYNSGNFGDITYYNPKTAAQISVVDRAALLAASPADGANLVTIGLVPLGSTDVGGPRFYIVQDAFPVNATPTTSAGIRFVNTVPNANGTVAAPSLFVRLRPAAGTTISLSGGTTHVANTANFNPTVGSRIVTTTPPAAAAANFTLQTIATAGTPIPYTLEASTNSNYTPVLYSAAVSFTPGKNYTVFMRGLAGKTGTKGLSYGVITHN